MKRRDEVLVGLFTTLALIILALGSIWLIRGGLAAGYPLYARFAWGSGIKQGAPVWLVGVTVGYVEKVDLDPSGTLVVGIRVEDQYRVPRGSVATIAPNGLFGDMAVALTPPAPNDQSYAPGDTLPSATGPTGIQALTARADSLSLALQAVLNGVRTQFVDSGGLAEVRRTAAGMNRLVAQFSEVTALQSRELQSTIATLRSRIAAIDSAQVDSTVRSLQATSTSLAAFTQELSGAGQQLNALLAKADSGNGSLALLLRDPGMYNDTRRLLTRIDSLVLDFKTNPRKYLKFSVF